ncbi:glycosyltransferase family 9 protein [Chloracidobacterium aggregatum]|uniref:glycosyltransferase family 9 protein n=1 Tax=Chloracidobacterium aggregatum TaxID=2851959 RepID=UPI001B8C9AAC|nr:glycosyltransferase family 9 protein [Chloracidobacterium aggregatum]QUV84710.1 hypothetical protein J8C03_11395 [Chloracidobacterium sp. 2]
MTYGPGETSLVAQVQAVVRAAPVASFPTNLREYLALARRATVFVGGDTGPLHLAAAVGTPIVGLYGPTSAERNGPFAAADKVVGLDAAMSYGLLSPYLSAAYLHGHFSFPGGTGRWRPPPRPVLMGASPGEDFCFG